MPGKRAADMLASYKSSLDPSTGHSGSSLLAEIREGTDRLANELDEYLENTNVARINRRKASQPLTDEGIADLQLATARKLREVRAHFPSSVFVYFKAESDPFPHLSFSKLACDTKDVTTKQGFAL